MMTKLFSILSRITIYITMASFRHFVSFSSKTKFFWAYISTMQYYCSSSLLIFQHLIDVAMVYSM